MLLHAGAALEVKDCSNWTPLQHAIKRDAQKCAEYLLEAGAKVFNLREDEVIPEWFAAMLKKRQHCRRNCLVVYGVLRKRWKVDGQRVPRDMINLLTRLLWESWRNEQWLKK